MRSEAKLRQAVKYAIAAGALELDVGLDAFQTLRGYLSVINFFCFFKKYIILI